MSYKCKKTDDQRQKIINYEEIGQLDYKGNVLLVKDCSTGKWWVKKKIDKHQLPIYERLHHLFKECERSKKSFHIAYVDVLSDTYIDKYTDDSLLDKYTDTNVEDSYIFEEYIKGETLTDWIAHNKDLITVQFCGEVVKQILFILSVLHNEHIIHRDIKPDNIIVTSDYNIYLIDFGIARFDLKQDLLTDTKSFYLETDTQVLGTENYASPEQCGFGKTDARSDIYSLGRVFLQLLSLATDKENYVYSSFMDIATKATNMDAAKRFSSAKKMLKAINNVMESPRKKRSRYVVLLVGIICIICFCIWGGYNIKNYVSNKNVLRVEVPTNTHSYFSIPIIKDWKKDKQKNKMLSTTSCFYYSGKNTHTKQSYNVEVSISDNNNNDSGDSFMQQLKLQNKLQFGYYESGADWFYYETNNEYHLGFIADKLLVKWDIKTSKENWKIWKDEAFGFIDIMRKENEECLKLKNNNNSKNNAFYPKYTYFVQDQSIKDYRKSGGMGLIIKQTASNTFAGSIIVVDNSLKKQIVATRWFSLEKIYDSQQSISFVTGDGSNGTGTISLHKDGIAFVQLNVTNRKNQIDAVLDDINTSVIIQD